MHTSKAFSDHPLYCHGIIMLLNFSLTQVKREMVLVFHVLQPGSILYTVTNYRVKLFSASYSFRFQNNNKMKPWKQLLKVESMCWALYNVGKIFHKITLNSINLFLEFLPSKIWTLTELFEWDYKEKMRLNVSKVH